MRKTIIILSLYVIGSNLTDQTYMPHLSRLKYIGIANMGRNVTFKIVVPFQLIGNTQH
ncbi:MAG: hypothetical protein J6X99_03510 [Bacteroidales bacterium]|nr:hypothetical protein [Bacteroidales bacterium]